MDTFYSIAIVIGALGFLFSTINVIYPIKRLGIPTRKRAVLVLVASIGLVIGGGTLIDPGKQAEQVERAVAEVRDEQELVRAEQRTDETEHRSDRSARGGIGNEDGDSDEGRAHKTASDVATPDADPAGSSETDVVSDRFEREVAEVRDEQELVRAEQRTDETEHRSDRSARGDIGNEDGDSDEGRAHKTASDVATPDADPAGSSETDVVSDRFVLQWDLDGTDLMLAIDTDLPDTAEVIVSVDRGYYEVGNDDAYSRYYFSEEGNISKWRNPRRVPIDDKAWKADLMTHQSKMSALSSDLAFEIDHIEDQIGVRAVVHVNQPDPRFGGRGNPNLSGTAVSRIAGNNNWYIVEAEKKIELLLTGIPPAKRATTWAGRWCVVSGWCGRRRGSG